MEATTTSLSTVFTIALVLILLFGFGISVADAVYLFQTSNDEGQNRGRALTHAWLSVAFAALALISVFAVVIIAFMGGLRKSRLTADSALAIDDGFMAAREIPIQSQRVSNAVSCARRISHRYSDHAF